MEKHVILTPQAMQALFCPAAVAVIGASDHPGKIGYTILANMLRAGFPGPIYPVNPKGGTIQGLPALASIDALPEGLDLAVISIPGEQAAAAMEALGRRKVKAVIVISAGFREVGHDGYRREETLAAIARDHSMVLLGPNCLGLINTASRVNATFAPGVPQPGPIAFFSQSGALCVAILDWAAGTPVGFSSFVSLGNKAQVDETHLLEHLGRDDQTKVILGYLESVKNGPSFVTAAREVTARKPIVLLKAGTTAAGARAASSHTGAIAGSDQAYGAAFRQAGIIRAAGVEELFNIGRAFSSQPLPKGPNLAVVTNAGGPGILTADAAEKSRLIMAGLSPATIARLKEFLPPYAALYNPVDIIGDADAERYRKTLRVVAEDPNIHCLLVVLTPTATAKVDEIAAAVAEVAQGQDKPVFACFMGRERVGPGQDVLLRAGVPCYEFPEPAIRSLEAMRTFAEWRSRPAPEYPAPQRDINRAAAVLEGAASRGLREVVEFEAQEVLAAYGLPHPATRLARTSDEAAAVAAAMGFPVVLKIASVNISHKSDVGGVRVGLTDEAMVREAFKDITARAQRLRPEAYISGCLVQAMAPKGFKEVIVGFSRDDQFGPLIMFGLGGVYVEVLKDISFRLAPLSVSDAQEMVREIRSYPLLKGMRGEPGVDFAAIERILLVMSQLAMDFPQVAEAEFNPVLVSPQGALVADVRLSLV